MSTEVIQSVMDVQSATEMLTTVAAAAAATDAPFTETELTTATSQEQFAIDISALNTTDSGNDVLFGQPVVFETFVLIEIVMTSLELIISMWAAIKMPKWRRNYRNQMLMQLTFARFIKRIIFTFKFYDQESTSSIELVSNIIRCLQIYIDFVIVILVFFFIKHMYNSLIIVLVKISHNNFYRVLICSWFIPVLISAVWTTVIVTDLLSVWYVNLVICCVFRWPLIFLGTGLYVAILYRVLSDKIRQFARSLAVVTFLLCLTINIYLFSKDVIELWCLHPSFVTLLIIYVSGFLMNLLILVLYIILIIISYNNKTQTTRSLPDYSLADVNMKC